MDAASVVRGAYEAFARHDLVAMLDHTATGVVLHVQGTQPIAGDHEGRDEVERLLVHEFGPVLKDLDVEVLQLDEERPGHVVVVVAFRGRAGGQDFESKSLHVHRVVDGEVVEMWFQPYDDETTKAFWDAIDRET